MEQTHMNQSDYGHDAMKHSHSSRSRQAYKSPTIAGILSLLPGLGQVYLGYYKQGLMNMIVFATGITISTNLEDTGLAPLFGMFIPFWFFYTLIDAVRRASLYNLAVDGETSVKLPDDSPFPAMNGSITGGIILVVVGILLFLNTMFDVSLAWLADWWPLAIIGGGIYLIYKDVQERNKRKISESIYAGSSID